MGEKVIVEEDQSIIDNIDKNIESGDVSEEIVSSVVGFGGDEPGSREGAELREDFLVLFDILWFPLKYGDDYDEEESDSETDDEDDDELTKENDLFSTLASLRKKIHSSMMAKQICLKRVNGDIERKVILEKGGKFE